MTSCTTIITYLHRKEQWGGAIPKGEQVAKYNRDKPRRRAYSQIIKLGCSCEVSDYFKETYADSPDVLTTADIGEMTGLHHKSIMRIILEGKMQYLVVGRKYHIPKVFFLEFVESSRFIGSWSNSPKFLEVLADFERWRSKRYPQD